jgi:hypothetical protein
LKLVFAQQRRSRREPPDIFPMTHEFYRLIERNLRRPIGPITVMQLLQSDLSLPCN